MIPLWLKIGYTMIVAIILVVYYFKHGPRNFLWFSDVALIVAVPAMWLENSLLASMMCVGTVLLEIVWNVSYFSGLLTGRPVTGLAGYMFDPAIPRYLRGLSLFHVFLPLLLLWLVARLGYDARALPAQTVLAWILLPLTYWLTDPAKNINWVYGLGGKPQSRMPPRLYLAAVMLAFPLLVFLPTHFLLLALFG